jgi:hypothetical protein
MMREGGSSQYGKSPSAKKAPTAVEHLLHVLDDEGGAHDIKLAPLPVSDRSPIVVAPPLHGEWIAGYEKHVDPANHCSQPYWRISTSQRRRLRQVSSKMPARFETELAL